MFTKSKPYAIIEKDQKGRQVLQHPATSHHRNHYEPMGHYHYSITPQLMKGVCYHEKDQYSNRVS